MENKIDKIITLGNNKKYMIIDQGNCNNKCYFFASLLDQNENLTDQFSILEETIQDGKKVVTSVKEKDVLDALIAYFKDRIEKDV